MNRYQDALWQRKQQHLLRQLPKAIKGIDFYSNDYLGLAKHDGLITAIKKEIETVCPLQIGATGSRLLSGNHQYTEQVEQNIADFHQVEAALLFTSGYTANVGLLSCIASKEDTLIMDELIHASLIDGARLTKAKRVRFSHNDLVDLTQKLKENSGSKIVVVESLYSMDGDLCPLAEMAELCQIYDAKLIVDEAHGIGVLGQHGKGLVNHLGLEKMVFATVATFGKAMGGHGAAILGPQWLKEYLINFSRPFIFTTGLSFHQLAAINCTYQYLPQAAKARLRLQALIQYLNQHKPACSFDWIPSNSQIQSVIIPGNDKVMAAANHLQENGIAAMGIRYPSVAKGTERIRICLHGFNTETDVDYLLEQLEVIAMKDLLVV